MKLSDLVAYRNALAQYDVESIRRDAEHQLAKIQHEMEHNNVGLDLEHYNLVTDLSVIHKGFTDYSNTLKRALADLSKQIELAEKPYFAESYRMYDEEMCHETSDYILKRRMPMSYETENMLTARIKSYSDWRYPGMVIRPGSEDFVTHMVDLDPLYLVDREHDLLIPAIEKFPIEYQRRLRSYYVKESLDHEILDKIPDSQIGLCLAFNFFEFKPFEILKKYLNEIYTKLRPGGVLIMTYNDCDRAHCVALVEAHFTCYTPGSMVRNLAEAIGFEQIFHWNDRGNLTWLELRKPGTLSTLRGGQTLAKVVSK